MSSKTKNPSNKKDSQLVIRINSEQRDEFVALCDDIDTSAAREIRRFIKQFIEEHKSEENKSD
ncbi:hypothetical protein [uncultured Vibrio sp.]|uniref:hypothetical protein n=1 Tax=uncultured Vibrio sp. TaxID=114054 RepID=UPI0025E8C966|nr:hypothetical protein [uncultured Vibrio sp.]